MKPLLPAPLGDVLSRLNASPPAHGAIAWLDAHVGEGFRVDRFQLANGLEVILWPDHAAPVAAWHTWFRVGSRHDPVGRTGMAHLFEHMMFKATTTRPEGEFDRTMESLGAQTNAATWVDWTNYHAKVTTWDLQIVCDLESDRMANLALDKDMLEREREVVKNERIMRVDDEPEGRLTEELYRVLYPEHPYGQPTIGWMEDIAAITLEDCQAFYRTWYSPSNAVLIVCGDFDSETILAMIQKGYGDLPAVSLPAEAHSYGALTVPDEPVIATAPVQAGRLVWAWRGPVSGTPEHAALQVATEILAGSDSARLIMTLVDDLEVATDVSAWINPWALSSAVEIGVTLRPDADPDAVAAVVEAALATFLAEGPTDDELERTRNSLETDFWRGLADVNARANQLGHAHVTVGDYRDLWSEAERLRAVAKADVIAAVAQYMQPDMVIRGRLEPLDDGSDDDGDDDDLDDDDDSDDEDEE